MIVATHYNVDSDFATMLSDSGNKLTMHTFEDVPYASDFNAMVITTKGDIYIAAEWVDKIAKFNKDFTKLVELDAPYITMVAIDPDGYIWTMEISDITGDQVFIKRDPDTLEELDRCDGSGGAYGGMIFDSNGYLYTLDWVYDLIEKWNVSTKTRVSYKALAGGAELYPIYAQLSVKDSVLYAVEWSAWETGHYFTCLTDLSADFAPHAIAEFEWVGPHPGDGYWVSAMIPFGTDGWIVMGVIAGEVHVIRYDNDFTLIWDYQIAAVGAQEFAYALDIGYYVTAYDYPLSPVMFPAEIRKSTLKQKCRHFEESMSDVCLVVNHNNVVTRRYLQEVYGDAAYPESSNFRDILPSQQLVKMMSENVDYDAIINNFITNISTMFTIINQNNTLVKTWLDDYEPDEKGHDFTDVKMRPITVGDDLSKTMDSLFEGIEDNVTILNANLELLKERF